MHTHLGDGWERVKVWREKLIGIEIAIKFMQFAKLSSQKYDLGQKKPVRLKQQHNSYIYITDQLK